MNEELQNFIEAVKNDEYAEYELESDLVVVTDWESDHNFNPVVIDEESSYSEQEVSDMLTEELGDVFDFEHLHFEEDTYYGLWYPEGNRFTNEELEESDAWC